MTVYQNSRKGAALTSVEFESTAKDNYSFFYVRDAGSASALKQTLASMPAGLEIIAETALHNQPVIIAKGKSRNEVLSFLKDTGELLSLDAPKKKFQPWKTRGVLSIVGQSFDLLSVWRANNNKTRHPADNQAYLFYSLSNISASIIDIVFGGIKVTDTHRMRFLKTQVNETLQPVLPKDAALPSVDEHVILKRDGPVQETFGEKSYAFIKHNSVYFDTALRWLGSVALIFPASQLKAPKWKDKLNKNPITVFSGASFVLSKIITLFSKIPDPYNPEPSTGLDKIREKVLFRASSATAVAGDIAMGYNGFFGRGGEGNKPNPAAGVANILFTGGDTVRLFAPFGTREIDMPELVAHAAQGVAKTAPDKHPQLLADVSSKLKTDLKDDSIKFGKLYVQMLTDLNAHHGVSGHIAEQGGSQHDLPTKALFADEVLKKKPVAATAPQSRTYAEKVSIPTATVLSP